MKPPSQAGWRDAWREFGRLLRLLLSLRREQIHALVKNTTLAWSEDKVPRLAAALAYYTALSLAPLIIVVLAIAGLAFGRAAAQGQLVWQIRQFTGGMGAHAIQALVETAHHRTTGIVATVLGLLTLFFGATSAIVELTDALNTIWHVPEKGHTGLRSVLVFLKERFVSFLMVSAVGILLLASVFINAWLAAAGRRFDVQLPVPQVLPQILNAIISFVVITFLFGAIYRLLPAVPLKWSDVAVGAALNSLLFAAGKLVIGVYLGRSWLGTAYGASGSFVILLVWIYYSAIVFFLGAELTKVYTLTLGSLSPAQPHTPEAPPRPDAEILDASGTPIRKDPTSVGPPVSL